MIVDGKNGYLIPLFDQEAFAEKLSKLMNDESLITEMGKYARESIKRFDVCKVSECIYQTITNTIR